MTPFLPKLPRRHWHPSEWNIVRVGSAIGATLALGACQDDVTSADASDTTDGADYSDWTDYQDGYHDYSDYSDNWDYSDYSDYSDYQDGWSDYSDYSDWYYECYVDEDCGPGMQCLNNYCVPLGECSTSLDCGFGEFCDSNGYCNPVELPAQCLAPALQQIPLPVEAGGVVVAMRFVDVDGDQAKELVLLRNDALVVVDGDQAVTVPHTAFALDGLAATDVDDDGLLDLVATSSTKLNSRVFLADGMGGFLDTGTGPGMMLDHAHGADWPEAGPGELVARSQADEALLLANVGALMPEIEVLQPGPISALVVGDFNGNDNDDVAMAVGSDCAPLVQLQGGGLLGSDAIGPPGACTVAAGDFDGDATSDLVTLRSDEAIAVVTVHAPFGEPYFVVGLVGAHQDAQPTRLGGADRTVLVQSGAELEYVFADPMNASWCRGQLDELPPVKRFASGDFDGDGQEELAVIDVDGATSLWSTQ